MAGPSLSLSEISGIYRCAADRTLLSVSVDHAPLRTFHLALRKFYRSLGEHARDEYWAPLNAWAWGYLRHSLVAPLPLDHIGLYVAEQVSHVRRSIKQAAQLFPSYEQDAWALLELAEATARTGDAPMVDALRHLHRRHKKETAIVLSDSRLVPIVRTFLDTVPELAHHVILRPSECRDGVHERMILVGGALGGLSYLITAPRAMEVCLIRYIWLPDGVDLAPVLATPQTGLVPAPVVNLALTEFAESALRIDEAEEIAAEIFPRVTPRQLVDRVAGQAQNSTIDEAEAIIFGLEGGCAVALDKRSSAFVITVEAGSVPAADRLPVPEIDPGMFLLLRTGGGQYITMVADQILGSEAIALRHDQAEWKQLLRMHLENKGIQEVIRTLRGFGSTKANGANVRSWASDDNICTQEFADFAAITHLIHRSAEAERLWARMEMIRQAHHQAGQFIRRRLEDQVKRADLRRMAAAGEMEFVLEDYGVSLTAYHVEHTLPDPVPVPRSRLGRLIDVEGPVWHE